MKCPSYSVKYVLLKKERERITPNFIFLFCFYVAFAHTHMEMINWPACWKKHACFSMIGKDVMCCVFFFFSKGNEHTCLVHFVKANLSSAFLFMHFFFQLSTFFACSISFLLKDIFSVYLMQMNVPAQAILPQVDFRGRALSKIWP